MVNSSVRAEEPWHNVVRTFCVECHDEDVQKAQLILESLLDAALANHGNDWERAAHQ